MYESAEVKVYCYGGLFLCPVTFQQMPSWGCVVAIAPRLIVKVTWAYIEGSFYSSDSWYTSAL